MRKKRPIFKLVACRSTSRVFTTRTTFEIQTCYYNPPPTRPQRLPIHGSQFTAPKDDVSRKTKICYRISCYSHPIERLMRFLLPPVWLAGQLTRQKTNTKNPLAPLSLGTPRLVFWWQSLANNDDIYRLDWMSPEPFLFSSWLFLFQMKHSTDTRDASPYRRIFWLKVSNRRYRTMAF